MNKKFDKIPNDIDKYLFQFNDLEPHTLVKKDKMYIKCRKNECSSSYTENEVMRMVNDRIWKIIKTPELIYEIW